MSWKVTRSTAVERPCPLSATRGNGMAGPKTFGPTGAGGRNGRHRSVHSPAAANLAPAYAGVFFIARVYVERLIRALRSEFHPTGVGVTILNPRQNREVKKCSHNLRRFLGGHGLSQTRYGCLSANVSDSRMGNNPSATIPLWITNPRRQQKAGRILEIVRPSTPRLPNRT